MKTDRRAFFQTLGTGTAGLGLSTAFMATACTSADKGDNAGNSEDQILFIGDDIAIAETVYGKVQGILLRSIYEFRGIPYGAVTPGRTGVYTSPCLPPCCFDIIFVNPT